MHLIFHHDDRDAADWFVEHFSDAFASVHQQGVTLGDDFVTSPSDDAIIRSIRDRYMRDATVAIVLLGETTWSRRFVDWEIAAALGTDQDEPLAMLALSLAGPTVRLPPRLSALQPTPAVLPCRGLPSARALFVAQMDNAIRQRPLQRCAEPRQPLARSDLRA